MWPDRVRILDWDLGELAVCLALLWTVQLSPVPSQEKWVAAGYPTGLWSHPRNDRVTDLA